MKTTIIIFLSFFMFMSGCTSSKKAAKKEENMQVQKATFHDWREAPQAGSDLPEVGSNLKITVESWPEGYAPAYVVFRGKKSVSTELTETTNNEVVISAKIIRSSAILMEKSESVNVSDRLVYTKANGAMGFIEIGKWEEVEN